MYIPVGVALGRPWSVLARAGGWLLNLNCAIILIPPMRTLLNLAISFKLNYIAPLDKNLIFHRTIAWMIFFSTILHVFGHYMNYSCCPYLYDPDPTKQLPTNLNYTSWMAAWGNKYGFTGHFLCVIMMFMYATGNKQYRRSANFTVFWYVHHLFLLFYAALLIHGKSFWLFLLPAGSLYILERVLRLIRGSRKVLVKRVNFLPGNVLNLELVANGFLYKPGQYAFVNCPSLSKNEWHPFTISSAPSQDFLTFHIRVVGDWTSGLKNVMNPDDKEMKFIENPLNPDGSSQYLRIDGPFGTSSDFVFDFHHVMLVCGGIGVTPFSSILRQIKYKREHEKSLKLKKVFFYWINRDEGSFQWFAELLNSLEQDHPDFFEIHTYMTGSIDADEIRKIVSQSDEFLSKNLTVQVVCTVTYDYTQKSCDELDLTGGEMIVVTSRDASGWWEGYNQTTKRYGVFPCNYVTVVDKVTGLSECKNRHYGRPIWSDEYENVRKQVEKMEEKSTNKPVVGVFFCGPANMSKTLKEQSRIENHSSNVYFQYFKENF
jgi:predicted ferric reductase